MADNNSSIPEYTLDPNVAASLRRPLVAYPNGMVPRTVIRACVPRIPISLRGSHDVRIDELLAALSPRASL